MVIFKIWNQKILFSIKFSKLLSKNTKAQNLLLEKNLKLLQCTANYLDNFECINCKSKLDQLYEEKANGNIIKSKCDWYGYREKSTKFFLSLDKNSSTPKQDKKHIEKRKGGNRSKRS